MITRRNFFLAAPAVLVLGAHMPVKVVRFEPEPQIWLLGKDALYFLTGEPHSIMRDGNGFIIQWHGRETA